MKLDLERTIVAVSSGLAPARRAVIRISGQETRRILGELIGPFACPASEELLAARAALSRQLHVDIGWQQRRLPTRVYYWPDHRCFTGEPSAELHVLGALPIVESLVERILSCGASPAERGEFTLRSFLAGKLDLPQAEAVLGVIEANSESQLEQALQQLGGNLSSPVRTLRNQLLELVAHQEAGLDFVEEDIEFISQQQLTQSLQQISDQLADIAAKLKTRDTRRRAPRIVFVGLPNAGKSSLFNALVGSERAIVSPQAGTTRDAVSSPAALGELSVDLIDTAGIEELEGASPRQLAQGVLQAWLGQTDVAVLCVDMSQPADRTWLAAQATRLRAVVPQVVIVGTKLDLAENAQAYADCDLNATSSALQAESVANIRQLLLSAITDSSQQLHMDAMHETAVRCQQSLELAQAAIQRALQLAADVHSGYAGSAEELVAAELRNALDDLSAVIGEIHSDDILGQIFSRFCIGK